MSSGRSDATSTVSSTTSAPPAVKGRVGSASTAGSSASSTRTSAPQGSGPGPATASTTRSGGRPPSSSSSSMAAKGSGAPPSKGSANSGSSTAPAARKGSAKAGPSPTTAKGSTTTSRSAGSASSSSAKAGAKASSTSMAGTARKRTKKSSKKSKKGKLTKAQKAEAKKAEEAKRLQAIADENARLERERAEQEEAEKIAREAQDKRESLEKEKKEEEEAEVLVWLGERAVHVAAWEAREGAVEEWGRYVRCETRPDPRDESAINTYINTWRENPNLEMGAVLDQVSESERVVEDIERLLAYCQERGMQDKSARLLENLVALRSLAEEKINAMTAFLIQHADEYATPASEETADKLEFNKEDEREDIKFGLWVNLSPNLRTKDVTFSNINCSTQICRQLALYPCAIRMCYLSYDTLTPTSKDSERTTLGGVLHFDILKIPSAPKTVNHWKMREIGDLSTDVHRLGYPIIPEGCDPANIPQAPSATWPALRVVYRLPPNVVVRDAVPTLGWWDREARRWETQGIDNVHFDSVTRDVSFETIHVAPTAVLQPHYLDLPFMHWAIAPDGPNKAILTLSGAAKEVVIEIGEGECRLIKPLDDALASLRTKSYSPYLFMLKLARAGINMIPTDAAVPTLSTRGIKLKDGLMEDILHAEMSLVVPAFVMAWSKWNSERSARKAVLKIAQMTDTNRNRMVAVDPSKWNTVLYDHVHREAYRLKATDETEHFTEERGDRAELHRNLYTCVKETCSVEAVMVCRAASDRFTDAVRHILNLIRPFSFA